MNISMSNFPKWIRGRSFGAVALTSLCLLGIVPAWADPAEARSVTVSFRDLNLSSPAGAKALYQRIQGAARQVCGFEGGSDPIGQYNFRNCYREAIEGAVTKVNNPLLTAVHTGRPPSVTAMAK